MADVTPHVHVERHGIRPGAMLVDVPLDVFDRGLVNLKIAPVCRSPDPPDDIYVIDAIISIHDLLVGADVPLPNVCRSVSALFEYLRDRRGALEAEVGHVVRIPRGGAGRHASRPRRGARGAGDVKVFEYRSVSAEFIAYGRGDGIGVAEAFEVAYAHVVGEEEDYVRSLRGSGRNIVRMDSRINFFGGAPPSAEEKESREERQRRGRSSHHGLYYT
mmetsp:Transcript_25273/g.74333  ORF Transcript_25273/g.74333 Transcript_25273/m.74333 type:complete len:217 (-) Transcript_25273:136-786(-)